MAERPTSLENEASSPRRVGLYRAIEKIGEGSMGTVCLAEREKPQQRVALKVIRPGALAAAESPGSNADCRRSIERLVALYDAQKRYQVPF